VKVGTTTAQKKLFFNLRRAKQEISELDDAFQAMTEKDVGNVAKKLGVKPEEVREMEERLSRGGDASLNIKTSQEDDSSEWQDWIPSDEHTHEHQLMERDEYQKHQDILNECLQYLTPREVRIIEGRRLNEPPLTLEQISQELSISKERVRQIEVRAFEKLRLAVKKELKKQGLSST
jgi:RNA polymerase sigma-32 factor